MLVENLSLEQSIGLLGIVPHCHQAVSNYEDEDIGDDCMMANLALCFSCILCCKKREKGFILMENLKEGRDHNFVDLKEIERRGVTVDYVKLVLDGLAHFHGAWWLWMRRTDRESQAEVLSVYRIVLRSTLLGFVHKRNTDSKWGKCHIEFLRIRQFPNLR